MSPAAGLGIVLALSWAGAGAAFWYLDAKLEAEKARVLELREAIGKEEQSRRSFEGAAATCGKSVQELSAKAARIKAQHARSALEAKTRERALADYVSDLLTRPAALNECRAMKEELDAEIELRARARGE